MVGRVGKCRSGMPRSLRIRFEGSLSSQHVFDSLRHNRCIEKIPVAPILHFRLVYLCRPHYCRYACFVPFHELAKASLSTTRGRLVLGSSLPECLHPLYCPLQSLTGCADVGGVDGSFQRFNLAVWQHVSKELKCSACLGLEQSKVFVEPLNLRANGIVDYAGPPTSKFTPKAAGRSFPAPA